MREDIPDCMADAPDEVIEAARFIARNSKNTLRRIIGETFPSLDEVTLHDFTDAICIMMAGEHRDHDGHCGGCGRVRGGP